MESYGLSYQMMQQIKAFSSGKPRFQRFGAAQQGRGFQNNNRGGFKNDRSQYDSEASVSVLQLEPALHELLSYELGDCELLGRHRAPSAEMKHLIATEQRKVALQVQLERLRTHEKTEKQSALESKNTLFGSTVRQREREMPSKEQLLGHQNQGESKYHMFLLPEASDTCYLQQRSQAPMLRLHRTRPRRTRSCRRRWSRPAAAARGRGAEP